jgi:hypothetical protein
LISLGKPTNVITPPTLRREKYGSNGWSPEAVSIMKCREFFRDCKSKRPYIHDQFSGNGEQTLLSCYLYSQHKKTIHGHLQNWLPGALKSNRKTIRKIVICYLFFPCEKQCYVLVSLATRERASSLVVKGFRVAPPNLGFDSPRGINFPTWLKKILSLCPICSRVTMSYVPPSS